MQCRFCGTQLSEGEVYCPGCAALTPYGIAQSQVTPDDPTSVSSSSYPPPPPTIPATAYGSSPYGGTLQNPYEPRDPYAEPQPPYAPPAKKHTILTVLIGVIVLLMIVVGVLGHMLYRTATSPTIPHPLSTNVATSPTTHYPFGTNLVLNDPLSNESHAAMYGWGVASNSNGGCAFTNGAYEITAHQDYIYCPAHHADFSNFTYEIQMTIKTGGTGAMGGVIFRHKLGTGKNYIFFLGTDGSYELGVNTSYSSGSILKSGTISSFATGFNQIHTIGIVANGSQISVYVDQNQVIQVTDTTYADGEIGMLSRYGTSSTTIAYSNAKVWQL